MNRLLKPIFATSLLALSFTAADAGIVASTKFSKYATSFCPASSNCQIDFGIVPAKRIYDITNISCYIVIHNTSATILYHHFYAFTGSTQHGRYHMVPERLGASGSQSSFAHSTAGFVRAPAGATMGAVVQGAAAGAIDQIECTISGVKHTLK